MEKDINLLPVPSNDSTEYEKYNSLLFKKLLWSRIEVKEKTKWYDDNDDNDD